jgi:hypothetical protein
MSVVVPSEKQYEKAVERLSSISTPALISVKNSLVKNQKQDDILLLVKDKLAGLSNPQQYKLCNDFLLYVCKLVEAFFVKKDKADKKQVVLDIMRVVFGHNDLSTRQIFKKQNLEVQAILYILLFQLKITTMMLN